MSCTPSDVRYIQAVRAGLARLDRQAAEKRQAYALEQLQREGEGRGRT